MGFGRGAMRVSSLGYVIVETTDLFKWRHFAVTTLGLMESTPGPDGSLRLRIDERPFRLAVIAGQADRFVSAGWEFRDEAAWEACLASLRAAEVAVRMGSDAEAANRLAHKIAFCRDP